ncbi:hypothetical protein EDB89DRAFT_1906697 [Lactarius sanguifluus]|nr:hypothetical protein EDB89DRAFT_1906697 [Lactarius sanguifluus]
MTQGQVIVWDTTTTSDVVYHSVTLQNPAIFNEIATLPEWGTLHWHYAMRSVLPMQDSDPIFWSIGLITEPAVQHIGPRPADTSGCWHRLGKFGDLESLATAQVYDNIQVTVGTDESDVMAFNIGGLGTIRVTNAVETLYSAFLALIHIYPELGGRLLGASASIIGHGSVAHRKTEYGNGDEETTQMTQSYLTLIALYSHQHRSGLWPVLGQVYVYVWSRRPLYPD